ncbi:MAG: FAD-dependent oxidoreductase [Campylobacterota bacterium]|nr:FAD-dependent oxidoreductase [Campylobacterota bacterium]
MEKVSCDVLIIGGGPAGGVSAVTAKMNYPEKKVLIAREYDKQLVPCAIPYIFGKTLGSSEKNVGSCAAIKDMGISTLLGEIKDVDFTDKIAFTEKEAIRFDKLIFATGSKPFVHESLRHALALDGVFTVAKSKELIDKAKDYLQNKQEVVIVGTGFIGVEMAMELASIGKKVTIISGSKHILKGSFDAEIAAQAENILLNAGVTFIGNDRVLEIIDKNSDNIVNSVKLESGKIIDTQVVILATGYKPNTELAQKVGISLGKYGGIWVDEYMRTENHDVFAVGDCSLRRTFITKTASKVMLASTSSAEGRVAGSSLYGIKYIKGFSGTISIFSTIVGDIAFSSAGVTEDEAIEVGMDVVVGTFSGTNRHPATIPGAQKQFVKLIATRNGGQIIGGQIVGGNETGEMINIIGLMIESGLSVYKVMSMQVATQPLLTAAPTNYPIVMAAIMAMKKIDKL